jgi:hypothetical protein
LNRAVRAPPIWRFPVGLGANLVFIIEIASDILILIIKENDPSFNQIFKEEAQGS